MGNGLTVEDLFLSDDLEDRGCDLIADEVRQLADHEDVGRLIAACNQLLRRAHRSPELMRKLLDLTAVEYVLRCGCGQTGPVDQSGSWHCSPEGTLVCPRCWEGKR